MLFKQFIVLCFVFLIKCTLSFYTSPLKLHKSLYSRSSLKMMSESDNQPPYKGPESTPILDSVELPADLKRLDFKQLKQLAHELRWETINSVSTTGGHLGSSLGVIELTIALHYIYDAPDDKIIWDVAHQAYPHKILTGRRHKMSTLRQLNGLSGFTNRAESEYDCFGAGHSSTSISAALGMSAGKQLLRKNNNNCVAIIGDGAITGGMAYEAMNNAAYINSKILVVLNDNEQVSLPTGQPSVGGVRPAGALSGYTSRLLTSTAFKTVRDIAKGLNNLMPDEIATLNKRFDEYVRGMATGGTLFEELGFYYVGPVDAHDIDSLIPILENIRDNVPDTKPVLLHIKSTKGKGYPPAEAASDKYHGVAKFDVQSGKQLKTKSTAIPYTSVFANTLIDIAEKDSKVVGITAAMPGGTGLDKFGRRFPRRTYDVGIAEQHALTFAAGMAVEGLKPFVAVYSTFMQRAYDQIIHDIALQKLPVRMILDRAGLVGNDGATHHGTFDMAYLSCIPDIVITAPSDEVELMNMIETVYQYDDGPSCIRYPRGSGIGTEKLKDLFNTELINDELPTQGVVLPIGKGRIIKSYDSEREKFSMGKKPIRVSLVSIGTRLEHAVVASREIESKHPDVSVSVVDGRFVKPLDEELISNMALSSDIMITIEEGSRGGFGAAVSDCLMEKGILDNGGLRLRQMVIPDIWIEHGSQQEQYTIAGLNTEHIIEKVENLVSNFKSHKPRGVLNVKAETESEMSSSLITSATAFQFREE